MSIEKQSAINCTSRLGNRSSNNRKYYIDNNNNTKKLV